MIISWIYWAINLVFILIIIRCVFKDKSLRSQMNGAMVIIPLILRVLFIK